MTNIKTTTTFAAIALFLAIGTPAMAGSVDILDLDQSDQGSFQVGVYDDDYGASKDFSKDLLAPDGPNSAAALAQQQDEFEAQLHAMLDDADDKDNFEGYTVFEPK